MIGGAYLAALALLSPAVGRPAASDTISLTVTDCGPLVPYGLPPEGAALLAALEVFDGSLRSMEWEQSVFQPIASGTWIRSESRRTGMDESGRWYARSEFPWHDASEGTSGVLRGFYFALPHDERLFTANTNTLDGKAAGGDDFNFYVTSPLHLMGRYTDFEQRRPLHELLASSETLEYRPPSDDEPWPMLTGIVLVSGLRVRLEVRIDPDHGYAPRIIRTIRADIGVPIESIETVAYSHQGDTWNTWVPTIGLRTTYYLVSLETHPLAWDRLQSRRPQFERARTLDGITEISDPLRASMAAAIARQQLSQMCVHDPSVFFTFMGAADDSGAYQPEVVVANPIKWNRELPDAQLHLPMPSACTIYDFFRDKRIGAEEARPMPKLVPPPTARRTGSGGQVR